MDDDDRLGDDLAAAVANAHIQLTRFLAALREAFEAVAVAARKVLEGMTELIRRFQAWQVALRRKVMWLERGRPIRLSIDGHAYQRRRRARMRRSGR